MAKFRYEGFADLLYRDTGDVNPVAKGGIGEYSQKFVDTMTEQGHRFTKVDELPQNAVEEAKNVKPSDNPALPQSGVMVDESRKPAAS